MKTEQPTIQYSDYKNLIYKLAWKWAKKGGWDVKELISEGNLVFCKILRTFDPSRSCFSTYLTISINGHFSNLTKGEWKPEIADVDPDQTLSPDASPDRVTALHEMLDQLGHDARILAECVLETPKDLIWMFSGRKRKGLRVSRNVLQQYFVRNKGWSFPRCRRAFKEVQVALATL